MNPEKSISKLVGSHIMLFLLTFCVVSKINWNTKEKKGSTMMHAAAESK